MTRAYGHGLGISKTILRNPNWMTGIPVPPFEGCIALWEIFRIFITTWRPPRIDRSL